MTCETAYELMQAVIDHQCTAEEQAQLHAHLDGCEDCRRIFEAYQAIQSGMLELEEEAPEGLARGVMYRIRKTEKKPKRFPFGTGTVLAAAAALLLLLVGSGVWKNLHMGSAPESAESVNTPETILYSASADRDSEEKAVWDAPMEKPAAQNSVTMEAAPSESAMEPETPMMREDDLAASLHAEPGSSLAGGDNGAYNTSAMAEEAEKEVNILRVHLHGEKASKVAPDEFLYPMEGGFWFESTLDQAKRFAEGLPDACSTEFQLIDGVEDNSLILVWLLDE